MTGPIIGARTPEQLTDNLKATGWALDEDQIRRLTEAGDEPLPYPYELQRLPQFVRRPACFFEDQTISLRESWPA